MNTWLFKHCRVCINLIALMVLMGPSAHGEAYLPLVGPPPMRFEATTSDATRFSWTPPALTPPTVDVETSLPPVTPTIPVNNVVSQPPVIEAASVPASSPPENLPTKKSAIETPSANNLLIVTPEMLVDYFKPNNDATNAANVHVLVPVNFTPPVSVSTPSSHASYISR